MDCLLRLRAADGLAGNMDLEHHAPPNTHSLLLLYYNFHFHFTIATVPWEIYVPVSYSSQAYSICRSQHTQPWAPRSRATSACSRSSRRARRVSELVYSILVLIHRCSDLITSRGLLIRSGRWRRYLNDQLERHYPRTTPRAHIQDPNAKERA